MKEKFKVVYLRDANEFLGDLAQKAREKTPRQEIERAQQLKALYFNFKKSK